MGVVRDDLFEPQFDGGTVGAVEDAAEGAGHFGANLRDGEGDGAEGVVRVVGLKPLA